MAFSLLGCLPQNRAWLCVLSALWENLALYLPAPCVSVCVSCLFGSLCVRCEDVHPVAVVPPDRKLSWEEAVRW